MKNLRRSCVAAVFALTLTLPAFAGEIETTLTSPQPAHAATTQGEIHTTVTGQIETPVATDSVAQAALNLLQSVLSLF